MMNNAASIVPARSVQRIRWTDMIHLTPEQAVTLMAAKGIPMCVDDAAAALRSARRKVSRKRSGLFDTLCDFKRDSIGKRLGDNVGTTELFRLITQKPDRYEMAAAA